jgi:hypothetical protein
MPFDEQIKALWQNLKAVDLALPFLYFISIEDPDGSEYRYVGKARDESRLHEYRLNMLKICKGKERGKKQGYRAVHFALYTALREGWHFSFIPLENCSKEKLNELERLRTLELRCNLNNARTWRVADMEGLMLKHLLRESRT